MQFSTGNGEACNIWSTQSYRFVGYGHKKKTNQLKIIHSSFPSESKCVNIF